jgi:hypothetical protein
MSKAKVVGIAICFFGILLISDLIFGTRNTSGGLKAVVLLIVLAGLAISIVGRVVSGSPVTAHHKEIPAITVETVKSENREKERAASDGHIEHALGFKHPQGDIAYHLRYIRRVDGTIAPNAHGVGYVRAGQMGTTPFPEGGVYCDYFEAQNKVDSLNAEIGVSKRKAISMIRRWRG